MNFYVMRYIFQIYKLLIKLDIYQFVLHIKKRIIKYSIKYLSLATNLTQLKSSIELISKICFFLNCFNC